MDEQVSRQLLIGGVTVVVGVSGWLLPYKYNLLRLKRFAARFLSHEANQMVPKVFGSIFVFIGVCIIIATLLGTRF